MNKTILITGGAGCLGSNLIEYYHAHGHDIITIDNFETSQREVLFPQSRLQVVEGSVADESLIKSGPRRQHVHQIGLSPQRR